MKGWIITAAAVIIAVSAAVFYYVYHSAAASQTEWHEEAMEYAVNQGLITQIEDTRYYYGRSAYSIFSGENESGEAVYVWVEQRTDISGAEEDEEWEPRTAVRARNEGISRSEAEEIAVRELELSEFKQVRLGMVGETPVYEIVYIDQEDRYSFYYLSYDDGSYIRHYQLRRDR
ncbi:cell wall elongation regulator TseB-like domain-containing protein [Alteribacter natronophilus]|uniref:cell wall elongation regulator TseB-like domain-containing protein n=1 Tax=Alteribacter natronophilus TaxID=2583810 RepID=UPI00110DF328|nr:DUF5590 domain-containing protein [Alteribacter natronophilus]TMW73561.1 hypothetical protein FGB90_04485 [Alteribacter natronophilus]